MYKSVCFPVLPAACVAIAAIYQKQLYLVDLDSCQLSTDNRYVHCLTYLTPCSFAVLAMIVVTLLIVRQKCCVPEDYQLQEKPVLNFWQVCTYQMFICTH
jgi:hypothetical protein